ncbi:SDR family NAD(P)-dependent oxidoreductase [Neisseria elongata]|jgi:hypothetical protein|uniref:SDR family NAD(P)-dependent oxidoreductase n=1 Tax=Neisseria elongata TaxID=495 RepID=UPI0028D8DFA0|nr:SDR family NAD(P)-dependent oxidoreductase [Neisseria elongata]
MRKAVISGHSRGLGYALAEHYLRTGWAVFGLARGRADLRPSENLFQAELDLSDAGLLAQKLSDGLLADFIRDADELLLINNAGTTAPNALLGRQGLSEIVRAVALNVTAPLLLSDYLLSARPDGVHLKIVHIGSGAGRREYAGWSVYGAGKAALDRHALCAAAEGHPTFSIACIAPGVVDTEMQREIRNADCRDFPLQPRFRALKDGAKLQSAADTAAKIAAMIEAENFGCKPLADVRDV